MPRSNALGYAGISVSDSWKLERRAGKAGNRWFVRITNRDGTRTTTTYPDEPGLTMKMVAEKANHQRAMVSEGQQTYGKSDLREIGKAYLATLTARKMNASYVKHIGRVIDALARKGLTDVKADTFRSQVEAWLGNLKANWWSTPKDKFKRTKSLELTGSLRNRILRELRSVLNHAVTTRAIAYNPLDGIKPFEAVEKSREIPSVSEMAMLTADSRSRDPWWLPACLLAYSGCRVEEAMHLEWRDIDLKAGMVHIRHKAGVYALKKKRERTIPLQAELLEILNSRFKTIGFIIEDERLRSNGSDAHLRLGRKAPERKKPTHHDYATAFRRYIVRSGMTKDRARVLSPHSLRHFYISAMLATGAQWDDVMQWAGHSQASTTLRYRAMKQLIAKDVAAWPAGDFRLRRSAPAAPSPSIQAAAPQAAS